ncbi:Hypothetical protein MVR_LOCUS256 [uncultured virus]|nr:Hypothetical protein MVR_LOCUS256 [uncultured virus]
MPLSAPTPTRTTATLLMEDAEASVAITEPITEAVPQFADQSVLHVDSAEVVDPAADLDVDSAEAVDLAVVAVSAVSMEVMAVMAVSSDLFEAVLTVLADLMPSFNATWVAVSDAKCF